jgi:hypothetical protein
VTAEIINNLGQIVAAAGTGAVVAWAMFTKFAESWLAGKFAKRLEMFKHEQASVFSRISKIHEKEFEVLPTAWLKLHQAYGQTAELCSALKRFPDLNQMNIAQFEAFVTACRLHEVHKKELLQLQISDRNTYYQRWIFWADISDAKSAQEDFNNYLVMNRIFMTESLCERFSDINKLLKSILITEEMVKQMPHVPMVELRNQLEVDLTKIQPLFPPLEKAIQERLHYGEA